MQVVARWPTGYTQRISGPRLEIVDPQGKVVVREGDTLHVVDACLMADGTYLVLGIGEVEPATTQAPETSGAGSTLA